eukprot:scaffold72226_cov19-Tisochrysis_lutea.AAC.1
MAFRLHTPCMLTIVEIHPCVLCYWCPPVRAALLVSNCTCCIIGVHLCVLRYWCPPAFRHLYVLAAQPRCVEARDVDSKQLVYVPLGVTTSQQPEGVKRPQVAKGGETSLWGS